MVWKIVKKAVRVTRQCGKSEEIIRYSVYDGDWQRGDTGNRDIAIKYVEKHGGKKEDIVWEP